MKDLILTTDNLNSGRIKINELYNKTIEDRTKLNNLTEIIPKNNLLNPSNLETGYYYDFTDGFTKLNFETGKTTKETMNTNGAEKLYVRTTFTENPNAIIAIYCYSNDNYLGYIQDRFSNIGNSNFYFTLKPNTTHIQVYTNGGLNLEAEQICISSTLLSAMEPYEEVGKIKPEAIPASAFESVGSTLKGKTIVNFGDSIFGNKRPPNDISTYISKLTGATVHNLGFGGCRMAIHSPNWDAFSMYRLADSIATKNYALQDSVDVASVSGMPSYFVETRALLKTIDFSKVDIVTISYGTNDYTANILLDNETNKYDTTTYGGALRHSIEKLLTAFPNLKIFLCTPTYRFFMDTNLGYTEDSDTKLNAKGHKLTDYVNKVKEIGSLYKVPVIDNYFELGINKFNRTQYFPVGDGVHHNLVGADLIARHMAKKMF